MLIGGRDDSGRLTEVIIQYKFIIVHLKWRFLLLAYLFLLHEFVQIFQIPVTELPSRAADVPGQGFDAWQLLRFGDSVLSWMFKVMVSHPKQQFRFRYEPKQCIISYIVVEDGSLPARLSRMET